MRCHLAWLVLVLTVGAGLGVRAADPAAAAPGVSGDSVTRAVDAESGLVVDAGWQTVRAQCGACHDLTLVTAQRGSRHFWEQTIRWMQATQNLWTFAPATEQTILDYLSRNYAPVFPGRRRPLPPELLPAPV